jgi:hypothetical protein
VIIHCLFAVRSTNWSGTYRPRDGKYNGGIVQGKTFGNIAAAKTSSCHHIVTFLCKTTDEILKVPKRENFSLAFFTLSESIWEGDLGTAKKIRFFITLPHDFDGFQFFAAC